DAVDQVGREAADRHGGWTYLHSTIPRSLPPVLNRFAPVALAALLCALPAAAQAPAAPPSAAPSAADDPDATLVEELVVRGRLPGPAWWRVEDADTTVWVLGVPSIAPRRMQWDRAIFERRLQGANVVVLPFVNVRAKLGGSLGTAFNLMRIKSGGPFEEK